MPRMTRRSILRAGLALPAAVAASRFATAGTDASEAEQPSVEIPFDMPGYIEPTFPDRTFPITDFGATPGGRAMNTKAVARAIAACAEAGGGRVVVPAGLWLTGPVHLKSNVNLHVAEGAELRFSYRFEDYLPVVYMQRGGVRCYNYSPLIYARDCTNIAVTGPGTLNGQGQAWWPWIKNQPGMSRLFQMGAEQVPVEERVFGTVDDGVRTCFIQPIDCKNVLLEGFTVTNGPSWNIHPVTCENVTVRGVSVTTLGPNNDGINPDSCRNVIVEDCYLDTGDDCICLKAGRNEDGWAVGKPCENVVVRRCRTKLGNGGVVFGSEMSAGIRNVFVHDCRFEGTTRGIRFKSQPGRGGAVENIRFQDISMEGVGSAIHMTMRYYVRGPLQEHPEGPTMPKFRDIHIRGIACENARTAVEIFGLPGGDHIEGITLENATISSRAGLQVENVHNLRLRRVAIAPERSPVMRLRDSREVTLEQLASPEGADVFLLVEGAASKDIRLSEVDLSGAAEGVVLGDDVPEGAVVIDPPSQ